MNVKKNEARGPGAEVGGRINLITSCFIILKMAMIMKTTNEVIMNRSRKPEK